MERSDVVHNPYFGGRVKRYHTWPTIQSQSVAEHTWNVMRIYWQIWGPMDPEVSTAILWHDAGEVRAGDPPFPTKADHPTIKQIYDAIEHDTICAMTDVTDWPNIFPPLSRRIKICDWLEMWEFGMVERAMGNKYADPIINNLKELIDRTLSTVMSSDDRHKVIEFMHTTQRRYTDEISSETPEEESGPGEAQGSLL